MKITKEELKNITEDIEKISFTLSQQISMIIESELKNVCEKYDITPDRLTLIYLPCKDNEAFKAEICIKLHKILIHNVITYGSEHEQ